MSPRPKPTRRATSKTLVVEGVEVELVRKRIRSVNLYVYPPDGRVRMSAPLRMSEHAIRAVITNRLEWIRQNQRRIQSLPRPPRIEMISGEELHVWGEPYTLEVVAAAHASTQIQGRTLRIAISEGASREVKLAALERWYRRELRDAVNKLLAQWSPRIGVAPKKVRVQKMRTRWGSCSLRTGAVTFNLELAKMPPELLELVVVHELAHFIERTHGPRFQAVMSEHLPDWRARQRHLDSMKVSNPDG